MTPIANILAKELGLPIKQRKAVDAAHVMPKINQDMHCFDVQAVCASVDKAIDHPDFWDDAQSMAADFFLPSPVTWLEGRRSQERWAMVVTDHGDGRFDLDCVFHEGGETITVPVESFTVQPAIASGPRVAIEFGRFQRAFPDRLKTALSSKKADDALPMWGNQHALEVAKVDCNARISALQSEVKQAETAIRAMEAINATKRDSNKRVAFVIMLMGLINTPGLIGLKQHAPHRGLQKSMAGRYPLRGWSEIVLKHKTVAAGVAEKLSGPAFHKCLHFVRSHRRHYRDGRVSIIPAHWRGDPALGIKQTRYRIAA